MDYKSNSSCSSPGKDKSTLERMDRGERSHPAFGAPVPVLPVRNNLRSSHFPPAASRFHFRKGLSSRCSWKCTAIVFILLFVLLLAIASYMSGELILLKLTSFTFISLSLASVTSFFHCSLSTVISVSTLFLSISSFTQSIRYFFGLLLLLYTLQ